jgi:hypothetical protein
MRVACGLVLLLAAAEAATGPLDALWDEKMEEMQKAFHGVETQLGAARQVADIFALETEQRELLALETRAKMEAVRADVQKAMENAVKEVEELRNVAAKNVTTWRQTLKGLQGASERNRQTLKKLQEQRETERQKQLEKLRQLELERQLEIANKLEQERELKRQREIEKKLGELHKKQEEEKRGALMQEKSCLDTVQSEDGVPPSRGEGRVGTVKQLLAWYVAMEQTVLNAAVAFYRQLLLPVAAILSFFLAMTVIIAKYSAMKRAQRNKRVLYSGYPKSYRRKAKQEADPVLADDTELRPRRRQQISRRDPDGLFGS